MVAETVFIISLIILFITINICLIYYSIYSIFLGAYNMVAVYQKKNKFICLNFIIFHLLKKIIFTSEEIKR